MSKKQGLADKLYREGHHFYGPFFNRQELVKGLVEAAIDLASNRIDNVKLMTLEEGLGAEYTGEVERDGLKSSLEDVQVIFGSVNPNYAVSKEEAHLQLASFSLSSGKVAVLRGVAFKEV